MGRTYAPVRPSVALTIAGSDTGGGAGIQADLKTMEAHGVFGTSVVTATTAQNTQGVHGSEVLPVAHIRDQYRAVVDDFDVGAVKTGMLATAEVVEAVQNCLADFDGPVVVDPVMVAATGDRLLSPEAEDVYRDFCADATLVTPNVDEAEVLTGIDVNTLEDARVAGERLVERGAYAALVKGGHLGGDVVTDTLVVTADDGGDPDTIRFEHPRIETDATHGSGCTLSSAIASRLAQGKQLTDAVDASAAFMERAVRYGIDVGEGPGSVHHLVELREAADRPATAEAVEQVVAALEAANTRGLVPEVGLNVAGASTFAEVVTEIAAIDGRITRTKAGVRANRGVRYGTSQHVASTLLAAREVEPFLRFAVNVRHDSAVEDAMDALGWEPVTLQTVADPVDAPASEEETLSWAIREALSIDEAGHPVAIVDRGAIGREPAVFVFAPDAGTLTERLLALSDLVG